MTALSFRRWWPVLWLPLGALGALGAQTDRTPRQVVEHHISAILSHDRDALLADYAADAVVVLTTGTFSGRQQIQQLFSGVRSTGDAPVMRIESVAGDVVVESYTRIATDGASIQGADVIVVRHGRIVFQATRPQSAATQRKNPPEPPSRASAP